MTLKLRLKDRLLQMVPREPDCPPQIVTALLQAKTLYTGNCMTETMDSGLPLEKDRPPVPPLYPYFFTEWDIPPFFNGGRGDILQMGVLLTAWEAGQPDPNNTGYILPDTLNEFVRDLGTIVANKAGLPLPATPRILPGGYSFLLFVQYVL